MRMSCRALVLVMSFALLVGVLGCSQEIETTTTVAATTSTTLPPTTTTVEITTTTIATTTTTTEVPGSWTAVPTPEEAPGPRLGGSLAHVPSTAKLYLYAGWDGASFFNGIWGYDATAGTWTDLGPRGAEPPARALHSMVYVPTIEKLVMFGGFDGTTYLNDTWAYDPAENTWTNLAPAGVSPAARDGHSLVFDPARGQVILFGGWNGKTEFGDTWAYNPNANTWLELAPTGDRPAARDSQAMTYDSTEGLVILFGGWNQSTEFNDTWLYDPAAGTWTNAAPAGDLPSGRALAQMVYDPAAKRVIMFGGGTIGNLVSADTWIYNPAANTWNQVTPSGSQPAGRTGHAMTYDAGTGKVVLFGGSDGNTYFNDLWTYGR